MLEHVENPKDIEYEISELGEPLLEKLTLDFGMDEETASDTFYNSNTFAQLADESTGLYKKNWREVYDILKAELKKNNAAKI